MSDPKPPTIYETTLADYAKEYNLTPEQVARIDRVIREMARRWREAREARQPHDG